ncbi:hypothetical protein C8P66_11780 [Humitalea rosea]|uniref:Uncharacterized protein n=1 Tax=Humitalea rosea TaxID=990373 RepID=A0A2W7I8N7_9PROT|nr:hypothetical protein [Humitalea rosea]PZW43054.1 hypothetical protein C8P66_11780 [Humitalea rosea]
MIGSRVFFMILSVLTALVGLLAAATAHDYLQVFGLGLFGFGVLYAFSCIKRHYDEKDAA